MTQFKYNNKIVSYHNNIKEICLKSLLFKIFDVQLQVCCKTLEWLREITYELEVLYLILLV
jgi:hypothetical protein